MEISRYLDVERVWKVGRFGSFFLPQRVEVNFKDSRINS